MMTSRNWGSLKRQLSIAFLSGMILSVAMLLLIINTVISKAIHTHMELQWRQMTDQFANKARLALSVDSHSIAQELVHVFSPDPNVVKVGVYKENDDVLAEIGESRECLYDAGANEDKAAVQYETNNIWCFRARVYDYRDQESMDSALELEIANRHVKSLGSIEIIVAKEPMKQLLQWILLASIATAIVITPIIYGSIQVIANRITRPLESLCQVMQRAEKGETNVRAAITGSKDIRQMEVAFNNMMRQIGLQEQSLEHQVKIRTLELVESQKAALSAANYKASLLASVSHEMRTPLHAVTGYLQLANEELEHNRSNVEEIAQWVQKALGSSRHLCDQIQQILDYSRIESGKMDLNIESFYPHELIGEVLEIVSPLIRKQGNELIVDNPRLEEITTDKRKISQVVLNFLTNANKFTDKGSIEVRSWISDKHYLIRVSDTGCGIPHDQFANIFKPFQQAVRDDARRYDGTGLGLAVSKHFSEMVGGHISVNSKLEAGSQFQLSVPISSIR